MVDPASIGVSIAASVLASLGAVEYRIRRSRSIEEQDEQTEWYAESARLAKRVQKTWEGKFERPYEEDRFSSFDEVQREMNLLHSQLTEHISETGDKDVDEEVVEALGTTATACREVYDLGIHMNVLDEFKRTGENAKEDAERLEQEALERL